MAKAMKRISHARRNRVYARLERRFASARLRNLEHHLTECLEIGDAFGAAYYVHGYFIREGEAGVLPCCFAILRAKMRADERGKSTLSARQKLANIRTKVRLVSERLWRQEGWGICTGDLERELIEREMDRLAGNAPMVGPPPEIERAKRVVYNQQNHGFGNLFV